MSAELSAILVACEFIKFYKIQKAVICTDSLSCCLYLINHIKRNQFNEVTKKICQVGESEIWIQWVPGHVGLQGNEVADELARKALNEEHIYENKILLMDAVINYKKKKLEDFDKWYQEEAQYKGQKFFQFQKNVTLKPWFYNKGIKGKDLKTFNRLLSGHDYSGFWLGVMKLEDSSLCDLCGVDNDSTHLILYCLKYQHIRNKYNFIQHNTLLSLIGNFNINAMNSVLKFLDEIDVKI